MKKNLCLLGLLLGLTSVGCSPAPKSMESKAEIEIEADTALAKAKRNDSSLTKLLNDAAGYAVFPTVGKGAIWVGGAYGKGILYENGQAVGYCDLTQATIGLQLGGQAYTEIIAFQTQNDVDYFKTGNFAFDAQATAVAIKADAAANANYKNGVVVFTMDAAGLMFEASVGGQKFGYQAK